MFTVPPAVLRIIPLALCLLLRALPTQAGLAQPLASCSADGSLQGGVQQLAGGIQLQRVLTADGVQLVEYANSSGTVFGLAWRGPVRPDLPSLLGSRWAALEAGSAHHHAGLHAASHSGGDIELRLGGHMRDFVGRAWAPSLLPAGFSAAELQP